MIIDLDAQEDHSLTDWEITFINNVEIRTSKNIMPSAAQIGVLKQLQVKYDLEWE